MLTVVTYLYNGWRSTYNATFVNALQHQLSYHLKIDHELVCITDNPAGVRCRTYPLWSFPDIKVRNGHPNNFRCLRLFDPAVAREIGERFLVLDLDMLFLKDIGSLITSHDFRIIEGQYSPYNSSMYLLRAGVHAHVWESFDAATVEDKLSKMRGPTGKRWVGSDQAWMAYCIPEAAVWTRNDGVLMYIQHVRGQRSRIPTDARVICFAGPYKPWSKYHMRGCPDIFRRYMFHWEAGNA